MLKLGICRPDQDTLLQRFWRRGLMSAGLLAIEHPATAAERSLFERVLPHIVLSNGVARTTLRGRFSALNELIALRLRDVFPAGSEIVVQDWAVSSGITAREWYERVKADYPRVSFTASDKVLYLVEARLPGRADVFILEPDGTPIQYVRPPFAVSLINRQHGLYPLNRAVQTRALRLWQELRPRLRIPAWNGVSQPAEPVRDEVFEMRWLSLLHPDVRDLQSESFRIREHSVFSKLETPVDVIRTMNVLNRAYFSDDDLVKASQAVKLSLKSGGLWIVGRSIVEEPPAYDATVYQNRPGGWEILARIGHGSEIEPLVHSALNAEDTGVARLSRD